MRNQTRDAVPFSQRRKGEKKLICLAPPSFPSERYKQLKSKTRPPFYDRLSFREPKLDAYYEQQLVPLHWIEWSDRQCFVQLPKCRKSARRFPCTSKYTVFYTPEEWYAYQRLRRQRPKGPYSQHTQYAKYERALERVNREYADLPLPRTSRKTIQIREGQNQVYP